MQRHLYKLAIGLNIKILKEPKDFLYDNFWSINGKDFKMKYTDITFRNPMLIYCGKFLPYFYSNIELLTTYIILFYFEKYKISYKIYYLQLRHITPNNAK